MITVKLHELNKSGPKQKEIAKAAVRSLEEVVNSDAFKEKLASATYTAQMLRDDDGSTREASNDEIIEIIQEGRERGSNADYEIDLNITLKRYPLWYRYVVGEARGSRIYTSYRFINRCIRDQDHASLAAHWMHEWLHTAGFYHKGGNRARGDVPYLVGEIVEKLIVSEENLRQ